jgi:hypothetical protein
MNEGVAAFEKVLLRGNQRPAAAAAATAAWSCRGERVMARAKPAIIWSLIARVLAPIFPAVAV